MKASGSTSGAVGKALLAAGLIALTAPAQASGEQPSTSAGQGNSAQAAPKEERKICKKFGITGSKVNAQKACHTAEEWKKIHSQRF